MFIISLLFILNSIQFSTGSDDTIECSSSNDDESFCSNILDKDHQTFWRSNDITESSSHELPEAIILQFHQNICIRNVRVDIGFCHYILDRADDFHFKEKLEECKNYHGEEDTSSVICGYKYSFIYPNHNYFTEDEDTPLIPITENFFEIDKEINSLKLEFKCYIDNNDESNIVTTTYHINAIVREVIISIDNNINSSEYTCLIPDVPSVIENEVLVVENYFSYNASYYIFFTLLILSFIIGFLCFFGKEFENFFRWFNKKVKKRKKSKRVTINNIPSFQPHTNSIYV